MQTIAQYIAKVVANKSTLYTPFYQEVGWEFLDNYFDHKRLTCTKGKVSNYYAEKDRWFKSSGFLTMWKNIKNLEMNYMRLINTFYGTGKIHENLQMFVDE